MLRNTAGHFRKTPLWNILEAVTAVTGVGSADIMSRKRGDILRQARGFFVTVSKECGYRAAELHYYTQQGSVDRIDVIGGGYFYRGAKGSCKNKGDSKYTRKQKHARPSLLIPKCEWIQSHANLGYAKEANQGWHRRRVTSFFCWTMLSFFFAWCGCLTSWRAFIIVNNLQGGAICIGRHSLKRLYPFQSWLRQHSFPHLQP